MPEQHPHEPIETQDVPTCAICGKGCSEDDMCFGCKHYVCEKCYLYTPFGKHSVSTHKLGCDEDDES